MTIPRRLLPVLLGALLLPATAHAGSYSVFTCKGPAGAAVATAGGWVGDRQSDAFATTDCPAGGPLAVGLTGSGPWNGGIGSEQRFTAPAGTRVGAVSLTRHTAGLAGAHGLAYYLYADDRVIDSCDPAAARCSAELDGALEVTGLDAGAVRFKAGCFESFPDQCTSSGTPLRVEVAQATISLTDAAPPSVASPTGTLAGAGARVEGSLGVTFNASDVGGGLYRTLTTVDGATTATAVAAGDCTDAAPLDGAPYQFTAATPCPASVNGISAAIDTTRLANGPHTADVLIEDAAGNRTTVVGARTFTVDNPLPPGPGAPNGVGADIHGRLRAAFVLSRATHLTNRFGRRVVIRGRLTDRRGKGIRGARVDVYHRLHGRTSQLLKTGLKTRADGRLTLILPLDLTTRSIELAYRARRPGKITSHQTMALTVRDARGRLVTRRP